MMQDNDGGVREAERLIADRRRDGDDGGHDGHWPAVPAIADAGLPVVRGVGPRDAVGHGQDADRRQAFRVPDDGGAAFDPLSNVFGNWPDTLIACVLVLGSLCGPVYLWGLWLGARALVRYLSRLDGFDLPVRQGLATVMVMTAVVFVALELWRTVEIPK